MIQFCFAMEVFLSVNVVRKRFFWQEIFFGENDLVNFFSFLFLVNFYRYFFVANSARRILPDFIAFLYHWLLYI